MSEKMHRATEATPSSTITLERTYRATAEKLWELWTTKEGFESWWAPAGLRAVVHIIEARPNGRLHYDMVAYSPEVVGFLQEKGLPTSHLERCRFSAFRPFEQLELKIMLDFVPDVEPYENTIRVDFFPSGEAVRMVATLGPTHSVEFTKICGETLAGQFANLEEQLSLRSA